MIGRWHTLLVVWRRFLIKHEVLLVQNSWRVYDQWCLLYDNRKREREDGKHSLRINLANCISYETLQHRRCAFSCRVDEYVCNCPSSIIEDPNSIGTSVSKTARFWLILCSAQIAYKDVS